MTTMAPGWRARRALTSSGVIMSDMGQPARRSGTTTVLSGERTLAVSAMKWTPQKTITGCSVRAAYRESSRESPTKSATSWISPIW